jgi:hypothetical protein
MEGSDFEVGCGAPGKYSEALLFDPEPISGLLLG